MHKNFFCVKKAATTHKKFSFFQNRKQKPLPLYTITYIYIDHDN